MSGELAFLLDGVEVPARAGDTILAAADRAGTWIPRLCHHPDLEPFGACRLCIVLANGRTVPSCLQPVTQGMVVQTETPELREHRRRILELLFTEGNHFCMFCEKSGACELQALGYRLGVSASRYRYRFPRRDVDASHPEILLDRHRCILCARCVRASRDLDGRQAFGFTGRGGSKRIAVEGDIRLADSAVEGADRALDVCPVGALLRKGTAWGTPVGSRPYDLRLIGAEVEDRREEEP